MLTRLSPRGSTVPDQPAGVFWAVVNHLFIIFQLVFLILSEMSWPMSFFDHFFPVLGSQFGLGPLGIFQGLYVCLPPLFFLLFAMLVATELGSCGSPILVSEPRSVCTTSTKLRSWLPV